MQKIPDLLSCDLTTFKDQSYQQSLNDRNDERQVNNCDLRIDRDICTFVIISMYIHVYPRSSEYPNL